MAANSRASQAEYEYEALRSAVSPCLKNKGARILCRMV